MSFEAIFVLRRELDVARQPRFTREILALYEAISALMPATSHAYTLSEDHRQELKRRVTEFGGCASCWPGVATGDYLYSLMSVAKLMRNVAWQWFDQTDAEVAYDQINAAADSNWVSLSRFTQADVAGLRGFTWWTSMDITAEPIWNAWRRMGLVDDWIVEKSVFLRCPVETTRLLTKVPSVIDGFDGPIFEPMRETPEPSVGTAIDLSEIPYKRGTPEFVLMPIRAQTIEVRPVAIQEKWKDNGTPAPKEETMTRLCDYYRDLQR